MASKPCCHTCWCPVWAVGLLTNGIRNSGHIVLSFWCHTCCGSCHMTLIMQLPRLNAQGCWCCTNQWVVCDDSTVQTECSRLLCGVRAWCICHCLVHNHKVSTVFGRQLQSGSHTSVCSPDEEVTYCAWTEVTLVDMKREGEVIYESNNCRKGKKLCYF